MCHRGARCFLGAVDGSPVAFAAILNCPGLTGANRISRIVVLPDWQGVGVGRAFVAAIGELYRGHGRAMHIRTSHQMMIRCLSGDARWRAGTLLRYGSSAPIGELAADSGHKHKVSRRPGVSFRYLGMAEIPPKTAEIGKA